MVGSAWGLGASFGVEHKMCGHLPRFVCLGAGLLAFEAQNAFAICSLERPTCAFNILPANPENKSKIRCCLKADFWVPEGMKSSTTMGETTVCTPGSLSGKLGGCFFWKKKRLGYASD